MTNSLKKLTLFRQLILVIQSRKLTITQKLVKLKKKYDRSNKYITTQEFNKLTVRNLLQGWRKQIQQAKIIFLFY